MPTDRNLDRASDDPIILPDGRKLVTLRDAGHCIRALPKAKQKGRSGNWQPHFS